MDTECPAPLNSFDFALGVLLLGGILVSYLPQLVKIGMRKSHVGLSLTRLVLATVCSSANFIVYVLLENNDAFYCCTSTFQCFSNLISFIQTTLIMLSDEATVLLAFYYFDYEWLATNGFDAPKLFNGARLVVALLLGWQTTIFLLFLIFGLGLGFTSDATALYGIILVGIASVGTVVVLLPQIYSTYKLKHVGSLSLETLFLQGFGTIILTYFSFVQNSWYISVPYACSAFFTIILFFEAIYYRRQDKNHGYDPTDTANHRKHGHHDMLHDENMKDNGRINH